VYCLLLSESLSFVFSALITDGPATTDDVDPTSFSFATLATSRRDCECGLKIVAERDGDALERRIEAAEVVWDVL
jgi:hypothetical protein